MNKFLPYFLFAGFVSVILLTCLVYWQGLDGPFLLDDTQNVVAIYMDDFDWSEIVYLATHNDSGIFGRPVPVLSFLFSGLVHGPDSWGFKLHNLMIHIINSLLIFWLFIRIIPHFSRTVSQEKIMAIAIVMASCWLLHPLMVSSVLYVVQRMAQLSTLFTLISLLSYVVARENVSKNKWLAAAMGYFFFPISLLLALLSKENGALIPLYVLAIEMFVFKFSYQDKAEKGRVLSHLTIFVAIPLLVGSYYVMTHLGSLLNYASRDFTVGERLLTQLHVVPFYVKLILFPQLSQMSLYHDDIEAVRQVGLLTVFFFVLLILSIVSALLLRKKAPALAFGITWFLISHLMESTFFSLELVFEHRNYLAAVGPIFVVSYYLVGFQKNRFQSAIPVVYIAMMAFLTWTRVQEWQSEEMIFTLAVQEHPASFRAQTEYANMMYKKGYVDDALEHLALASEIDLKGFGSVLNRASYICNREEEVESLIKEAVNRAENYIVTVHSLNSLEFMLRQAQREQCTGLDLDQVLRVTQASIRRTEINGSQHFIGYLQRIEGHALLLQGEYTAAVDAMLAAYQRVKILSILIELADMQINVGRLDDAGVVISEIERLNDEQFGASTSRVDIIRNDLNMALEAASAEPE